MSGASFGSRPWTGAAEHDQLAGRSEPHHRVFDLGERRDEVGAAADGEERQHDAVDTALVAAERRQDRLAEIRDVADRRLEPRLDQHPLRRLPDGRGQRRATGKHHRFAAQAGAKAADAASVNAIAPVRMREREVQRRHQSERPHRLHRDKPGKLDERPQDIGNAFELDLREPRIAVERSDDDVAIARELHDEVQVAAAQRTAAQPVRERDDRPRTGRIGKQRRLAGALHMRHAAPVGQHVVGARAVGAGRVADQQRQRIAAAAVRTVEFAIVGDRHRLRVGAARSHQQVAEVARRAVVAWLAFPVHLGRLAGSKPRKILADVAAADRIRSRRRHGGDDGERIGGERRRRTGQRQPSGARGAGRACENEPTSSRHARRAGAVRCTHPAVAQNCSAASASVESPACAMVTASDEACGRMARRRSAR